MRNHGRFLLGRAAALALLLACGCNLPGTFGVSSEPTPSPTRQPGAPHPLVAPAASANATAPVTGPGPAPILPLNLAGPESPQDVISLQNQKLSAMDDDRKLLAARLMQREAELQEKEKALAEAADDIGRTGEEINRTRADVRRVKQENADLADKLERSQKEVIDLRKQIIKMMEALPEESKPGEKPGESKPDESK
jgi:hypothetical protein